eukprot:scaffold14822_cov63-Phaeocystis_antarctica.AAC.2
MRAPDAGSTSNRVAASPPMAAFYNFGDGGQRTKFRHSTEGDPLPLHNPLTYEMMQAHACTSLNSCCRSLCAAMSARCSSCSLSTQSCSSAISSCISPRSPCVSCRERSASASSSRACSSRLKACCAAPFASDSRALPPLTPSLPLIMSSLPLPPPPASGDPAPPLPIDGASWYGALWYGALPGALKLRVRELACLAASSRRSASSAVPGELTPRGEEMIEELAPRGEAAAAAAREAWSSGPGQRPREGDCGSSAGRSAAGSDSARGRSGHRLSWITRDTTGTSSLAAGASS